MVAEFPASGDVFMSDIGYTHSERLSGGVAALPLSLIQRVSIIDSERPEGEDNAFARRK
jgi:hypothetical protein